MPLVMLLNLILSGTVLSSQKQKKKRENVHHSPDEIIKHSGSYVRPEDTLQSAGRRGALHLGSPESFCTPPAVLSWGLLHL